MYRRYWLFLLFTLSLTFVKAQVNPYPQGYFQTPMDTPLYLSAPFGSLRDNHFHSGMDIRTYEKEGLPVYAIADGYVSRIKYSSYGYGKALYITHPNGYTSVYGHLQNANGAIAAYIKKYQYEMTRFEFDHFPGKDKLLVKKGDTIGWSGNSGASTGPHLHFEIRNTRSEEILNPQLFGIPVVDNEAPAIKQFAVYSFDEQGSRLFQSVQLNFKNSLYTDSGTIIIDTILVPMQTLGFAFEGVDYLLGRTKEYSVYGMDLQVDRKPYSKFRKDRFTFADSRSINKHIDYAMYKKEGIRIQKLFIDDGNTIKLYSYIRNKGKYIPTDTLVHQISCSVYDFNMRSARIFVFVKASRSIKINKEVPLNKVAVCYPNKGTTFQNTFIKVVIPPKALYDTLNIEYELLPKDKNMLSATHRVQSIYEPLQKSISISVRPDEIIRPEKMVLAYSANGKNWRSAGGAFADGFVTANSNVFGLYAVSIDTLAPVITALFKNKYQPSDSTSLKFKIIDDFSGVDSYKLTINGKWVLAEYDAKNDVLEYFFDENTPKQKLDIELIVADNKANKAVLKTQYLYDKNGKE